MGFLSGIFGGAASGSTAGPGGAIAGAAIGALPSILGLFTGNKQRKAANRINPIAPTFVANSGILDNQRILNQMYNNYTLPGSTAIKDNLDQGYATALNTAAQGATSSSDVLDSAAKLSYNQGQNLNALGLQEAQGKQQLLSSVLSANEQAGNEAVRKNQLDEERYQALLKEKAALTQAGAANTYNAVDGLATLGGSLLNYKSQPWSKSSASTVATLPAINFRGVNGQIIS